LRGVDVTTLSSLSFAGRLLRVSVVSEMIGLVSGFKKWGKFFLVLQAYIDESEDDDSGGVFCLAGYLAPVVNWRAFSQEWKTLLDMKSPAYGPAMPYFKMSEMACSQIRREKAYLFYQRIESNVSASISICFKKSDFTAALSYFGLSNVNDIKNPYIFSFKLLLTYFYHHKKELSIFEPVDFIFDEKTESSSINKVWDLLMNDDSNYIREIMGGRPLFENDKLVLPLQAADLYAYWVRRWMNEGHEELENLRFPWKVKREIPSLVMYPKEQDFLSILDHMLHSTL
ncbi:MAG: DUF3800 domain-containing protein, partial [Alphaproteobacteria bacterium]